MRKVAATNANFIKLGNAGGWELECLRDGVLRFGYGGAGGRRNPDWSGKARAHGL